MSRFCLQKYTYFPRRRAKGKEKNITTPLIIIAYGLKKFLTPWGKIFPPGIYFPFKDLKHTFKDLKRTFKDLKHTFKDFERKILPGIGKIWCRGKAKSDCQARET